METFNDVSHIKVHLQDALQYLNELLEARKDVVLRTSHEVAEAEFRVNLGVVKGLELAIDRLQYNFGDEQVNEVMYDTRY